MELDTTTFILEVINFLVLLWLLNRFLFRPASAALAARAAREEAAAQVMADGRRTLEEKSAQLDASIARFEALHQEKLAQTGQETAALRLKAKEELAIELEAERQKARQSLEMELDRARMTARQEAHRQAGDFVANYLRRLACPALEAAIVDLFVQDFRTVELSWVNSAEPLDAKQPAEVVTAFVVPAELKSQVESAVAEKLSTGLKLSWGLDSSVVAGIRLHLPGHQLECSLAQGLDAFRSNAARREAP